MVDVAPHQLDLIKTILKKHIPDRSVWAFGSRVTGQANQHSDLDLVILGAESVDTKTMAMLEYDFQISEIPFRVDLIQWATTSEPFRQVILKQYEKIV
ncbi:MAG TPA: nucleotidyltransferase domain-containing protein [bacterium]|nr:nucleotidyltransferase domain-containing protein [bacterium]